jgi:hypothetical protein
VGTTAQLEVLSGGRAALGMGNEMVVLQKPPLRASSGRADERAPTLVALPDRAFHGGGNMTPGGTCQRRGAGTIDRGVPGLPQRRQEQAQRPLEDRTNVAVGHAVSEQILACG